MKDIQTIISATLRRLWDILPGSIFIIALSIFSANGLKQEYNLEFHLSLAVLTLMTAYTLGKKV